MRTAGPEIPRPGRSLRLAALLLALPAGSGLAAPARESVPVLAWSHGEISAEQRQLRDAYDFAWHDPLHPRRIYLTFDLGTESGHTLAILDALAAAGVKATFFVTSDYLHAEPLIVARMLREGHVVGNHSERHPCLPRIASDRRASEELARLGKSFEWRYGRKLRYFRFPQGEYDRRTLELVRRLGYKTAFWGFAYRDWDPAAAMTPEQACETVLKGVEGGDVVLLHAVMPANAKALPAMIAGLKGKGFEFATLDDYPWQDRPAEK